MSELTENDQKILEKILNPNEQFELGQQHTKILHVCNKMTTEEKKILKKEIKQNVPFISDQYEFILGQQIVQAVKELNLDCCVVRGLYVRDFMPGFVKKDESYELNDYEEEIIQILRIEDITEEQLERMILLHTEQKEEFKKAGETGKNNGCQNTSDSKRKDKTQIIDNQTQSKTQCDIYTRKVIKKVLF